MSLIPPHLPSPAPTPDDQPNANANQAPGSVDAEQRQAHVRAEVEAQLLRLSQDLYEMEICAGDVGIGMEERVPRYLMEVSEALVRLEALSGRMEDSVPKQIIEAVDQHRNPHVYTKSTLTRAAGENQYALGRMLGLESFRRQLHSALRDEFPDLALSDRRHVLDWEHAQQEIVNGVGEMEDVKPNDATADNVKLEEGEAQMPNGVVDGDDNRLAQVDPQSQAQAQTQPPQPALVPPPSLPNGSA